MGYMTIEGGFLDACHERLKPNEPWFPLCAYDVEAPGIVRQWADEAAAHGLGQAKYIEARSTANTMDAWYRLHSRGVEPSTVFEAPAETMLPGSMPVFILRGQDLLSPDLLRQFVYNTANGRVVGAQMPSYPDAMLLYLARRPLKVNLGEIIKIAWDMERWTPRKFPD